jgi:hypothetical protein
MLKHEMNEPAVILSGAEAESKDFREEHNAMVRGLIRSLPIRSASGFSVGVAGSPTARFSTSLEMTAIIQNIQK